ITRALGVFHDLCPELGITWIDSIKLARELVRNGDEVGPRVVNVTWVSWKVVHGREKLGVQPRVHRDTALVSFRDSEREGIERRILHDRFCTRFPSRVIECVASAAHLHDASVESI